MKTCSKCEKTKPRETEFFKSPVHRDGYHGVCRECRYAQRRAAGRPSETYAQRRRWKLRMDWGLEPEDYDELLTSQNGVCAICAHPPGPRDKGVLHIDHDHTTGEIRGLLCAACNSALGLFRDSSELLDEAARYLRAQDAGF